MISNTKTSRNLAKMLLVAVLFSFIGCDNSRSNKQKLILDIQLKANDCPIEIYTIDGCEYIGRVNGFSYSNFLTHKGNCKFCLARHVE